ncbi:cytochrome c [Pseudoduganella flava]|uniref:C-type cytochrome n=1 Tax=Pseudoduganella flava TaxID=871742 RepID=A0A562PVD2_9BURK|nr:c-type cytochrome [Pseudoduganella flava]QGZ39482.1 c-type cytochrome [Pseudoduganella flava]TWI48367.1 cytochrome c [Pseudoduganella flava]
MSDVKTFSLKNPWFTRSVLALVGIALVAALIGFVWVPRSHARDTMLSLWESICRAAGVPGAYFSPGLGETGKGPSEVIVMAQMMAPADNASIGRGATLAMRCTMCHGARGMSPAGTPHLAGQVAAATYKQLRDYKSGHRQSAIMRPLVEELSDQDMRDLAAYYAYLPRERLSDPVDQATPRLVRNGDPVRNVGACASCHTIEVKKPASPWLDGLPESYLRQQLLAFREGSRHNDVNSQMRNAVRNLSDEEVAALARYYASR